MKQLARFRLLTLLWTATLLTSSPARAEGYLTLEGQQAWQSRNDQRIPGTTGTKLSLSKFDDGPFNAYRIYAGTRWGKNHELRGLYAPFILKLNGQFKDSVDFAGKTFAADTHTNAIYKFNSYRLTYAYHYNNTGAWKTALGFTAKVRDAEVRLTQGSTTSKKANVGFVPLLNFQAERALGTNWKFRFDFDGLAAKQGRAFDVALLFERTLGKSGLRGLLGYRTLEGGADNDRVYNFAWIHYAVFGLSGNL